MNAKTQGKPRSPPTALLGAPDLAVVLALVRGGNLQEAGGRLGVDASTVFRAIQRIERGLKQRLFDRSRTGYRPLDLAQTLAGHAEQMEVVLECARSAAQARPDSVGGTVRITSTDTVLHALVAPALKPLRAAHPLLRLDLHSGNEPANLTRRDADIAVRATKRPPQHLVGKRLGPIRVALYTAKRKGPGPAPAGYEDVLAGQASWIAPDDALPEHPSVLWRRRHFPKALPDYKVNSILTVAELVAQGLGVGVLPLFLAQGRPDLLALTEAIDECETDLWLLTHAESRHLRRVSAVFGHLGEQLRLE